MLKWVISDIISVNASQSCHMIFWQILSWHYYSSVLSAASVLSQCWFSDGSTSVKSFARSLVCFVSSLYNSAQCIASVGQCDTGYIIYASYVHSHHWTNKNVPYISQTENSNNGSSTVFRAKVPVFMFSVQNSDSSFSVQNSDSSFSVQAQVQVSVFNF